MTTVPVTTSDRADFLGHANNLLLAYGDPTPEERYDKIVNGPAGNRADYIRDLRSCSGQDEVAEEDLQAFLYGCKG